MSIDKIVQIYHSREDRLEDLCDPSQQVQLESARDDAFRIKDAMGGLFDQVNDIDEKCGDYLEAMFGRDKEAAHNMTVARRQFIESWANTQLALSKIAWVMHIDGNEAYQRMVNARKDGQIVDMSGL